MTCEELAEQLVFLTTSRDAAQALVDSFNTAIMYNWWNQYLQGCIPGMTGSEFEKPASTQSLAQFTDMLKAKPLMGKLIKAYMEDSPAGCPIKQG